MPHVHDMMLRGVWEGLETHVTNVCSGESVCACAESPTASILCVHKYACI